MNCKIFTSIGLIPYYIENSNNDENLSYNLDHKHIYYLMIQRKDTIGFSEFIRGKYNVDNKDAIQELVDMMTITEKKTLFIKSFHELWHSIWYEKYYTNQADFLKSKHKFDTIMNNNLLKTCIENSKTKYIEPEWGFPKGRKLLRENYINCAIREMKEETNIDDNEYDIITNIKSKEESYDGYNNTKYLHKYYLCKLKKSSIGSIFNSTLTTSQKKEVNNIGLFHYEECVNLIRDYHQPKLKILNEYNELIKRSCQFKILSPFYTKYGRNKIQRSGFNRSIIGNTIY